MTGEITLRGLVLPVGGIKEKTLAAARAGVKTVVLPAQNKGDLEEIDAQVKKKLKFVLVENVDQALEAVLGKQPIQKRIQLAAQARRRSRRTPPPAVAPPPNPPLH